MLRIVKVLESLRQQFEKVLGIDFGLPSKLRPVGGHHRIRLGHVLPAVFVAAGHGTGEGVEG